MIVCPFLFLSFAFVDIIILSWIFKSRCHCRCRESPDHHLHRSFSAAGDSVVILCIGSGNAICRSSSCLCVRDGTPSAYIFSRCKWWWSINNIYNLIYLDKLITVSFIYCKGGNF